MKIKVQRADTIRLTAEQRPSCDMWRRNVTAASPKKFRCKIWHTIEECIKQTIFILQLCKIPRVWHFLN